MNSKRMRYATLSSPTTEGIIKEEIVPVIIHESEDVDGSEEAQYTYAYTTEDEDTETAVVTLSDREHEALTNAQEVIIDENGHPVTLQQLVENSTGEVVETIEQGDGTHTILHIVPSMHDEEEDDSLEQEEEDILAIEGDEEEEEEIVFEDTIEHFPENDAARKTFYCPNCGNCYSAAGSLKLHMRACLRSRAEVPPEDRQCKVCKKVFNSVAYLKEHLLRHSGELPFRCSRCYRKFVEEAKYQAHMESHRHQDRLEVEAEALSALHGGKKVVVKEFNCSFCSQNFTVVFEVGQVKRRYACDGCRDKYSNAEALRKHKQQIDEKREFSCDRCGRKFVFEGFLQRHLPTCDGSIKRRRDMK